MIRKSSRILAPIVSFLVLAALAAGCGGAAGPAPTPAPEPTIPSDFTTYTDEEQLFSISYPSEWELALSEIPDIEEATRDLFESTESDLPLEDVHIIFGARMPPEQGTQVAVTINVAPVPVGVSTLEQLAEAEARGIEALGLECEDFAQVATVVGAKKALIFDRECDVPGLGKSRGIQMSVIDGKTAWTTTCSTFPEEFPSVEETCNQVVRSLRILR